MITRDPDDGLRSGEYLDCDTDEYCWGDYKIPRSQKARLFQRSVPDAAPQTAPAGRRHLLSHT